MPYFRSPCFERGGQAECNGWHCGADVGKEFSTKERESTGRGVGNAEGGPPGAWRVRAITASDKWKLTRTVGVHTCVGVSSVPDLWTIVHDLWQLHYEGAFSPLEVLIYETQKLPLSSTSSSCSTVEKVFESEDKVCILALLFSKIWGKILIFWWLNDLICEVTIIISMLPTISQSCQGM